MSGKLGYRFAAVEEHVASSQEAAPNGQMQALFPVFLSGSGCVWRAWQAATHAVWCAGARCRTLDSRSASRAVAADALRAVVLGTCPTHLGPAGGRCTSRPSRAEVEVRTCAKLVMLSSCLVPLAESPRL